MTARILRLGDATSLITSGSRGWRSRLGSGSGRFVLAQCVRDGILDLDGAPAVAAPSDKEAARSRVEAGDLLVTIVGDVGRVALVRDVPDEVYVSQSVALIRPNGSVKPTFLEAYLRSPGHGQAYFRQKQYGVGRGHLLLSHLREMPIQVPDEATQESTVARIDERLTSLEAGKLALIRAEARLDRWRDSIMMRAFPDPSEIAHDAGVTARGWRWSTLGEISSLITKGTTPTSVGFRYRDSGIRFVKAESLIDGRIDHERCAYIDTLANEALSRSQLESGDVLFSIAGTLGRSAVVTEHDVPANANQAIALIRLHQPSLSRLVRYWLTSPLVSAYVRDHRRGVGLFNLNLQQVRDLLVPIPMEGTREDLVQNLDDEVSVLDRVAAEVRRSLRRVEPLRGSILHGGVAAGLSVERMHG